MIPLIPNPIDWGIDKATEAVDNWLVDLAGKAGQSAQLLLEKAATFWVTGIPSPQLTYATAQNPYTPASTVAYMWSHLHFYVAALAVLSVFIGAGKMAIQRNGAPARELLQSILTLVVVSSAGIATISLLTTASDEAASYILKDALTKIGEEPTTFQAAFGAMFVIPNPQASNSFLLIGIFTLVLFASFVQVALLIVRGGMLFLLAGVLPLAAAASNTETGRQWLKKTIAWAIAFLLYKPVAAIVYATAFQLTREGSKGVPAGALAASGGDQLIKVITGLVLCIVAIFALPALMRFTVPAVAAASSGGGGAVAALGGALGMGAKAAVTGAGSGSGSGGGGGKGGGGGGPQKAPEGGPQGNPKPAGGKPPSGSTGQTATKASTAKAGAVAGPAGAVAGAVTEGLKKTSQGVNSAVSNAAGEESPGAAPGKSKSPSPGSGPSGGSAAKGKTPPPTSKPPQSPPPSGGPSGGKSTPPNNPPTTEGPSGGKR
jgi:hypothetical protein